MSHTCLSYMPNRRQASNFMILQCSVLHIYIQRLLYSVWSGPAFLLCTMLPCGWLHQLCHKYVLCISCPLYVLSMVLVFCYKIGNHIDVSSGKWTAQDAGIGAGVDSYIEYLVKGAVLFQKPQLMKEFHGMNHFVSFLFTNIVLHTWLLFPSR